MNVLIFLAFAFLILFTLLQWALAWLFVLKLIQGDYDDERYTPAQIRQRLLAWQKRRTIIWALVSLGIFTVAAILATWVFASKIDAWIFADNYRTNLFRRLVKIIPDQHVWYGIICVMGWVVVVLGTWIGNLLGVGWACRSFLMTRPLTGQIPFGLRKNVPLSKHAKK